MARVFKRGTVWWIGYRLSGDVYERRESSHSRQKEVAMVLLAERTRTQSTLTVTTLLDRLEQEYQIQGRKSLQEMIYHAKPVRKFLGHMVAETMTLASVREYIRARQQAGRANSTINREISTLSTAFQLAYKEGEIHQTLLWPRLEERGIRQGTYTFEEMTRMAHALPEHLKPVAWFAYYTGRRRGEILQITWGDIEWTTNTICIRASTTKTDQPDRIPLVGSLRTLLSTLQSNSPTIGTSSYIFTYRGKPIKSFNNTWKRALKKAGLVNKLFHDLRRTASTDLSEAGVPEQIAMRITGHKSASTYRRYNIVRSKPIIEGLEKLEEYRKGQSW